MPQFKLLVLTNPVKGRETEFNDWYSNTHLADVLRVPGIVRAQRLRACETQRNNESQVWQYVAIYECDAPNVKQIIDGLADRSGTAEMPLSSAMAETRIVCFYEAITEVVSAAP